MLAAMSAGYQRMLAKDASNYALQRIGVGGPIIRHELPRLALGRMLGGSLLARSLAYLSLQQDADGVDLAGLRDLTKSASASAGLESIIACEHVMGGRSFDSDSRVHEARVNLHLFGVVEGEDDMIRMGMVRDVTSRFVRGYLAVLLDVIREANTDDAGNSIDERQRILSIGPTTLIRYPKRTLTAMLQLIRKPAFWRLNLWVVREALSGVCRMPLRLFPGWALPRYTALPASLRCYIRYAERKLRLVKWQYLALSLVYQLELTRAQIPLQRLGLCIEHLVSMLAICHHASVQDESQQDVAVLQAQVLKEKYQSIQLLGSLRQIARTRRATAVVGARIEKTTHSLLNDIDAEAVCAPME